MKRKPLRYAILIEKTRTGYSAHVPDLLGCVAAAATRKGTVQLIREAIEFHMEGMRLNGESVSPPFLGLRIRRDRMRRGKLRVRS